MLTTMQTAVQLDKYDISPASYAGMAREIINEILSYRNLSNQLKNLLIKLNVTQWVRL